jgi:hypothetical protein
MLPKTTIMASRLLHLLTLIALLFTITAPALQAQEESTTVPQPAPIGGFQVLTLDANIAPTMSLPTQAPEVVGQPKNETDHPSLIWDQDDIDHYKAMLKTSKELQIQFDVMKAKVDAELAQPVELPEPQKGANGQYPLYGDTLPPFPNAPANEDGASRMRRWFFHDSDMISDIATIYVLTGDEKYGEYAKKLLLGWAHCYEWGPVKVIYRSGIGAMDALFVEGLKMDHFAFAYDLIYNLKSWTPEERKQLHDDFFYPMADSALYPGAPDVDKDNAGGAFVTQITNRGLMSLGSVYAAGVVTGDQQLINAGLYGIHTPLKTPDPTQLGHFPPRQDWYAATADNPGHGLLNCFFAQKAIPGGVWIEGSPGYAFYVLGPMLQAAEIGWHHNVDFYRNNNGIFKCMFDFPILLGYPDLTTPGLNDAHHDTLLVGAAPTLYEYAYRRYNDPRYLAMINSPEEKRFLTEIADPATAAKVEDALLHPPPPPAPGTPPPPPVPVSEKPPVSQRHLNIQSSKFGGTPPSFMYDLDPNAGTKLVPPPSVNYPLVGFGVIRTPSVSGKYPQGVILSYGPTASHGHPDKLAIDLFALDDVLIPTPGIMFPYQNPLIPKWNHTTLAHNTLTVDEKSQEYLGSNPRSTVRADQTVFAPASTVGMERAWSDTAYKDVTMDRALFMTPQYMVDLFSAFSGAPHKYDLAWHIRGDVTSDLTLGPVTIDSTVAGYNTLTNVRGADAADKPWSMTLTRGDKVARLHVAGQAGTQAIVGDGGIYVDATATYPHGLAPASTIIERRDNVPSTVFGSVVDFSNNKDGYVKGVAQEGGLDKGYAMLTVTTQDGTDLCFISYRTGNYSAGSLQTDATQALVSMNGTEPQTLYLVGGRSLKVGDAAITRSDIGLAFAEKTTDGNYIVGNPSPTAATVSVTMPALASLKAYTLDANGQKGAAAQVTTSDKTVTLQLPAGGKVEFAKS